MVRTMSFPSPEPEGSSSLVRALMIGEEKEFQFIQPPLSPDGGPDRRGQPASLYPSSKNLITGHILVAHSPHPEQV